MMKPILFNTEMVIAILEGRKTVTRRILKLPNYVELQQNGLYTLYTEGVSYENQRLDDIIIYLNKPYEVGDTLYVRETHFSGKLLDQNEDVIDYNCILYAADKDREDIDYNSIKWKPSIHMPKEAARIFLKVTGVRVERLQDINGQGHHDDVWKEGYPFGLISSISHLPPIFLFEAFWNSTVKNDHYKWKSNPWVWVVEFEQIEKQEVEK